MNWLAPVIGILVYLAIILVPMAAWVTHVVTTIQLEQWVLLVVGALVFPVGIVHGIGIWFGLF